MFADSNHHHAEHGTEPLEDGDGMVRRSKRLASVNLMQLITISDTTSPIVDKDLDIVRHVSSYCAKYHQLVRGTTFFVDELDVSLVALHRPSH